MSNLLKTNIELKNKLTEAEAEISALRQIILTRYDFNQDEYQNLLRTERAKQMLKAPFFDANDKIIFKISQITGVTMQEIMGKSRKPHLIIARFACYWALCEVNKLSLSEAARYFRCIIPV
jgi:chromosomal replication initiation ATPase DnaA